MINTSSIFKNQTTNGAQGVQQAGVTPESPKEEGIGLKLPKPEDMGFKPPKKTGGAYVRPKAPFTVGSATRELVAILKNDIGMINEQMAGIDNPQLKAKMDPGITKTGLMADLKFKEKDLAEAQSKNPVGETFSGGASFIA